MKLGILKDRTAGFYIGIAAAVVALGSAVAYIATDLGDRTFSMAVFVLMLLAAVFVTVNVFWRDPLALLPSAFCAAASVGVQIYFSVPTVTDILNKVNFYGGNHTAAVVFPVLFLAAAVLFVAACFMRQYRDHIAVVYEDESARD